jgi:hypothetical protein
VRCFFNEARLRRSLPVEFVLLDGAADPFAGALSAIG